MVRLLILLFHSYFFLETFDIVRKAYDNIIQLIDNLEVVSKSSIAKYISKNKKNPANQKNPLIVMLLTNSAFSTTIQKYRDFFFHAKLDNFVINNNKYRRFIWVADEADETIVSGSRVDSAVESTFFNTPIGLDNQKKTFFEHCSMVVCVSATNIAAMMSAKSDDSTRRFVEPLGTNSVLSVGNDYVGFNTGNVREILIKQLSEFYYSNETLDYTRFFKSLLIDLEGMDLDRINRIISDPLRKINVRYKSVLINTAQSRRRNQVQEDISKTIYNCLRNISSNEQPLSRSDRFKYVVFSYNGITKKTKTRKVRNADNVEEDTIVSATLYSNSTVILRKFLKAPHTINFSDDAQTIGSVSFELPSLAEIYSLIFQTISSKIEKKYKWIVTAVSGLMASRGTTFKDSAHIYPLTDLYYETSALDKKNMKHYEATLEEIGRLCSKDRCMMPRTLHLRKIKLVDDYDFIQSALSAYDFFYKVFTFQQNSPILRFSPLRLDEVIQQYSQFLLSQQQRAIINPEEHTALSWYFHNYLATNNELTRKNIAVKCKHRLDDVCEKESPKHARLNRDGDNVEDDGEVEPTHLNNIRLPSAQFQTAFERDLLMLANEANEPRFANRDDPLDATLAQFVTSIGSNDATWKTLAKHLIEKTSNGSYRVKDLDRWIPFDQSKSLIALSTFNNLQDFRNGASKTWRHDSKGSIIKKNGTNFKLSWHV